MKGIPKIVPKNKYVEYELFVRMWKSAECKINLHSGQKILQIEWEGIAV